jgi:hypothetical protein
MPRSFSLGHIAITPGALEHPELAPATHLRYSGCTTTLLSPAYA